MDTASETALKAGVYAMLSLATALAFSLIGGTSFSLWLAFPMAIASALIVQRSDRGKRSKLVPIFFWLAAAHAVFGYWAAGYSTGVIWMGSNAERMFRHALFVITATLMVAAFTFDIAPRIPSAWARRCGQHLRLTEVDRLIRAARALVLLAASFVVYLIATIGFLPMLAASPGQARYIFTTLGQEYHLYDWIRLRSLELLAFSLPLVLFSGVVYRKKLDCLIGISGVLGILVIMHRGTLISAFLVLMLTVGFVKRKFPRRYFGYLALLAGGYFVSQLVYLNVINEGFESEASRIAILSGLPEVRDLGWVVSAAGDERFYGATFAVPIIPGPGIATEFKKEFGLGYLTARLVGTEEGLRVTLPGEGYLNFGVFGFLIAGVVFGMLCAWLSDLSEVLQKGRDIPSNYLIAVLFAWLCFWFYLGGTANAVTTQYEVIFIFWMFFVARGQPGRLNRVAVAC